ncbi:hypothetical protein HPC49_43740 [Pyxidicoccus fallax]|uniref:Lipoprotein n=1 Tax=Pyxidicoccus fallax TaxID=394095 RepID=A0A848LYT9_9BACT|nr:hypothetical protein [Pyxidicoccus fallax]NMO22503.1 hypothetical protein [Pyxidicoccus fallax]NPC85099.1 hypothetical protein [Pyxidicoccus fallax]
MTKGSKRWVVGLLAGVGLAVAGCQGGEGDAPDREGHAFETPQHREDRPKPKDEAEVRGTSQDHPAGREQEAAAGQFPRGSPLGGGTAGPNEGNRDEATGVAGRSAEGLGLSLADSYRAPPGNTATGGSGAAGQPQPPQGGQESGSAVQGTGSGGGAGTASGGGASGQEGPK